jgi:hypothetical protein
MKTHSGRIGAISLVLALMPVLASAQADKCPTGTKYIGNLYGAGAYNSNLNARPDVLLPPGIKLDQSKHQTTLRPFGGGSDARSNMQASEVPAGLFIAPYGTEDHNKGWAVHSPALLPATWDGYSIKQFKFTLTLYCTTGSGVPDQFTGGCNVNVPVCVYEEQSSAKKKNSATTKPKEGM